MYDTDDIVELKNRKKRRKRRRKFLIFLLIAAVVTGFYYYRDSWLPKLRGIGKQYQIIKNDGELAEGKFPIEINGGAEYQLRYSKDTVFLLCDAYIYYYNTDGGLLKKRQHAYSNPVLNVSNGRALIYESGGDELTVEGEDEIIYSKTYDNNIMFARLSLEGFMAVVTSAENYTCRLCVYNDDGDIIYERNCVERICDLSFTDESEGCVLCYIGAKNGSIITNVQKVSFNSKDEKWTSPDIEVLGLDVYGCGDGAFLVGYTACAYLDSSGEICTYYEYDGDYAGSSSQGGNAAIIINDNDKRKYTLALLQSDGSIVTVDFDSALEYVTIKDGLAYVLCKEEINAYDFSGSLRSTAEIADSYYEFRRSEDYIFLMGYDRVDRIDYSS